MKASCVVDEAVEFFIKIKNDLSEKEDASETFRSCFANSVYIVGIIDVTNKFRPTQIPIVSEISLEIQSM